EDRGRHRGDRSGSDRDLRHQGGAAAPLGCAGSEHRRPGAPPRPDRGWVGGDRAARRRPARGGGDRRHRCPRGPARFRAQRAARRRQPRPRGDVPLPHLRRRRTGDRRMSTQTLSSPPPEAQSAARPGFRLPPIDQPVHAIPFGRLVRVELRKQVDTLAGRWFLISIGLVVAAAVTIMLFVDGGDHSYLTYLTATSTPLGILVPVLGILSSTQEWTQRTAMTTYALEPRRGRVIWAKVLSALLLGVAAVVLALALAAVARLLADARGAEAG